MQSYQTELVVWMIFVSLTNRHRKQSMRLVVNIHEITKEQNPFGPERDQ